ncbi:MAG: hypothetical protein NTZ69_16610 [Bacteroidia bacterium]|nr:hypothetical protein [Bacteroidia bacterium]
MAPGAVQVAPLQKDDHPDPRTIVDRVTLDVKHQTTFLGFYHDLTSDYTN